jgi:hypothetical protein
MIAQETLVREVVLRTEVERQIREIGRADILVGIPSFNSAGMSSVRNDGVAPFQAVPFQCSGDYSTFIDSLT